MNRIISENPEIIREEISREEAEQLFAHEPLKLELLAGIPQTDTISIYRQSEFIDLCRGPHLASAGQIKAFRSLMYRGLIGAATAIKNAPAHLWESIFLRKGAEQTFSAVERGGDEKSSEIGSGITTFMFSEEAPGMPFICRTVSLSETRLNHFCVQSRMPIIIRKCAPYDDEPASLGAIRPLGSL